MVLLLLGVVAVIGIATNEASDMIRENVGLDVSMRVEATDAQINILKRDLNRAKYVASVKYVSKDEAMELWKKETGEDLMEVLGFNPLTDEFEVHVKSQYASIDSLERISLLLRRNPVIEDVKVHQGQVETMNKSMSQVALILLIVACVMLVISLVLINNTVRMTMYSRRFLIHTMKLVGATPAFIRRPIVVSNMMNGIIAAIIALAMLAGIVYYVSADGILGTAVQTLLPKEQLALVAVALIAMGAVLCSVAAFFAANKYIRLDYDKLF